MKQGGLLLPLVWQNSLSTLILIQLHHKFNSKGKTSKLQKSAVRTLGAIRASLQINAALKVRHERKLQARRTYSVLWDAAAAAVWSWAIRMSSSPLLQQQCFLNSVVESSISRPLFQGETLPPVTECFSWCFSEARRRLEAGACNVIGDLARDDALNRTHDTAASQ